jgi:phosphoribosyl-AMP cyclohydrolase / phosphoribosyl-ATP pyrophosphohydrolase
MQPKQFTMSENLVEQLKFDEDGLIPAIIQDQDGGRVLMLAYMNRESLDRTIQTGETWFWSRSRKELWHKGATSGSIQKVVEMTPDCDGDTLLVRVNSQGPACHTGAATCFTKPSERPGERARNGIGTVLDQLSSVINERKISRPANSYTTYLFETGLDKILKKLGEESAETIIAAKNADKNELTGEISDLLYHLLVLIAERDLSLDDIATELRNRQGLPPRQRQD